MKKVLITGATGMVGGIVLRHCLEDDRIGEVVSISRRTVGIEHPKLKEVIHADFSDLSALDHVMTGVGAAYYCIGVYTGAVPKDVFRKITVEYTEAFVNALKAHSPEATFCFLSGAGADQTEKSRVMFARDKGAAENLLLAAGFPETYIFRPAYIYPVESRNEPNFVYRLSRFLYPLMKRVYPSTVITSEELGLAMFTAGLAPIDFQILENQDIKSLL